MCLHELNRKKGIAVCFLNFLVNFLGRFLAFKSTMPIFESSAKYVDTMLERRKFV